jgi:hypothetical protein
LLLLPSDQNSAVLVAAVRAQRAGETQLIARTLIRRRAGLWFLLATSFLLSAWASIQIWSFESTRVANTFNVSLAALLWLVVYLTSTTRVFGTAYLLSTAYILALFLFHFGLIAQDGFGIVNVVEYRGGFGHWITLAGWYSNLALGCLGFAFAATCLYSHPPPPIAREAAARLAIRNLNRLRNLGIGLCFACIVFLAIGILQVGNILSYDRLTLFFGGMDIRGIGVFVWIAPSAAVALAISAHTRRQKCWSYPIGVLVFVVMLLSGNRTMALFPLLVGVVIWVKTGRKIPILVAAGLPALILLIIPVVGTLREKGTYQDLSSHSIAESSAHASVSSALAELGQSAEVLAVTLQAIPAEEPYRIGASYLGYLRSIIPNVGPHKDFSKDPREIMKNSRSLTEGLLRLSPSTWASVKILGVDDALYRNFGVGFSAVAEPYFNFGYLGVVGFFLLVGFFLARMDCNDLSLEYPWLLFASIFYWQLVVTVRNDFGNFTNAASFTAISLGVWLLFRRLTPFARP